MTKRGNKAIHVVCLLLLAILALTAPAFGENGAQGEFMAGLFLEFSPEGSPDYQGAAARYEKAAEAGSREALLALARLSAHGGPPYADGVLLRERLMKAALAGWPEAAYMLALALEKNEVPRDGLNPAQYYLQAAAAGHGPAAMRLGQIYRDGLFGLPADEKQAALWFSVAARNNIGEAALALGKFYAEKPSLAAQWLEMADLPEAAWLLGEIRLKEGRFIEAVASLTVAADRGYPAAHLSLGLLSLDNEFGRRPNEREALRHLKIAAQAGIPEASYQLAQMYIEGKATPRDSLSGAFWLHKAAEKGHVKAKDEYEKLSYNFSIGQKKRLERMILDGLTPTMQTTVE